MALTAASILDRVRSQLVDEDATKRWSDAELLRLLSDGQRMIATMDPSATSTVSSVLLASGSRQTVPSGGKRILSVIRNMGTDGATPGRAVRLVDSDMLDTYDADWHAETKALVVKNYMFDPSEESAYYVWPPSNGVGYVQLNYSKIPVELTATTDSLAVSDIYAPALFDYTMWRAHSKDSDFAGGQDTANRYLMAFNLFMQSMTEGETNENANVSQLPFTPQVQGAAK